MASMISGGGLYPCEELFVIEQQVWLHPAAKEAIDPNPFGLAGKLGLNEAHRVCRAAHVSPFNRGRFLETPRVPFGKPPPKFIANGVHVRRDDNDL
jgi:hypothetical protein